MKKHIQTNKTGVLKKVIFTVLLVFSLTLGFNTFGQDVPPPPPNEHGSTGNEDPTDSPIGGGLFILLGLGLSYGGLKAYTFYKAKKRKLVE